MKLHGYRPGFSLVELLVVVTIIVVLLALLAPALDEAVYQAELAVCGARLKATGGAVTLYAFDHKRQYPYRELVRDHDGYVMDPMRLTVSSGAGSGLGVEAAAPLWDDRPVLRGHIQINAMLQCPLTGTIDMEIDSATDTFVYSTYSMWWGWTFRGRKDAYGQTLDNSRFTGTQAMFKLGDRFSWDGQQFSVLAGDTLHGGWGWGLSSHPEKQDRWSNWVLQHQTNPWGSDFATFSWWGTGASPAQFDSQFTVQDGSVRRYNDLLLEPSLKKFEEAGLRRVPGFVSDDQPNARFNWLPPG